MKSIPLFSILIFIACTNIDNSNKAQNTTITTPSTIQNYPDSIDYWVNSDYLKILKSGQSVSDCLWEHEFLLVHLDTKDSTVLFQSSVFYFGLETMTKLDFIGGKNDKEFVVNQNWPLDENLIIKTGKSLSIFYKNKKIIFEKIRLKTLAIPHSPKHEFDYNSDIFDQRNYLNATSLLQFPYTYESDSSASFVTFATIQKRFENSEIQVSCSDDYYYNSVVIDKQSYHLKYYNNRIEYYEEKHERNRFEKINLTNCRKQIFYKVPQN